MAESNFVEKLSPLQGLGFIRGSCTPHYDGKPNRRPDFHQLIKNDELPPGIGIDDGAAVLFEGQQVIEVVASRPTAKAYQVKLEGDGQIGEESLEARFL
ncbi:MAG: Type 1 glutamine amidotransferase-like domain-containing protein [Phormidium tanganyikae FI6-MK23]|jgi:peptidase E|nr:Type 1 glutamine amidotransferase-like domain-containing protein [Phormidium tanganyikae FI6-MK23]